MPRTAKKKSSGRKKPEPKARPAMPENPFDKDAPAPETAPLDAFATPICKRLRHLRNMRAEWKRKRGEEFERRDGAKAEIAQLGPKEKAKREQYESVVGNSVMEIDRLSKSIRWAESETFRTIDQADDPRLYDDVDEKPMPPAELFEVKPKKDASSVGGETEPDPDQGEFGEGESSEEP